MKRSVLPALALLVLVCLGTASATGLGHFDDVVLSGTARTEPACTASTVEFFDVLETPLSLGALTGSTVGFIGLSDFDPEGDCDNDGDDGGMRPVVILIGLDGLGLQESVLSRTELEPISGTSDTGLLAVPLDDQINSLLDVTDIATEARVVFCPAAATQCGASS